MGVPVHSLKIEGRTNLSIIGACTAQMYRRVIDAVAGKPDPTPLTIAKGLAHRGYTEGFYVIPMMLLSLPKPMNTASNGYSAVDQIHK